MGPAVCLGLEGEVADLIGAHMGAAPCGIFEDGGPWPSALDTSEKTPEPCCTIMEKHRMESSVNIMNLREEADYMANLWDASLFFLRHHLPYQPLLLQMY